MGSQSLSEKESGFCTASSCPWSRKTPDQGDSLAFFQAQTSRSLVAEPVSCAEKVEKTRKEHAAMVQLFRTRSSRHEQFHRSVRFQPSCALYRRTSHVSTSSQLWLPACTSGWHIATLVLALASASKTLWSTCPSIGQDATSDRLKQPQIAVVSLSSSSG